MNRALIDEYQTQKRTLNFPVEPWAKSMLANNVYKAKRFVFDDSASEKLGELVSDHADVVANDITNLHMPYPEIYIELSAYSVFKGRGGNPDPTADMRIGFLCVDKRVICLVQGGKNSALGTEISPAPFSFKFNTPQEMPLYEVYSVPKVQANDVLEIFKASFLFGGQRARDARGKIDPYTVLMPNIGNIDRQAVADQIDIKPVWKMSADVAYELTFAGGGDPFVFIAALQMINERSKNTLIMEKAAQRIMHKGKSHALPAHSVVSVHYDKNDRIDVRYLVSANPGKPRREHDVRGHWAYYGHDDGLCVHAWEPLTPENTKQYICSSCRCRKTWRAEHVRGDIALGRVDKVYSIKK